MLVRSPQHQRRGVILLVVLAMITLFASIGVAFVYFAEQEATKSLDQKAGETVKLPDADMLYTYVMRQIVFPTNNASSVLYTHSLLENLYGRWGVTPFSGSGIRPRMYRDNRPAANVIDPQVFAGGYTTNVNYIGQDEMYRLNRTGIAYDENIYGSLNPTYTYPDHKNAYLGNVAANYTDLTGTQHGPTAIARSFAREMKFRIAIIDPAATPGNPNVVGYQDYIINPYTPADYTFWSSASVATNVATGQRFYVKQLPAPGTPGGLPAPAPMQYAATPGAKPVLVSGLPAIQCDADGSNAWVVLNADAARAHTLRPEPRTNPNFPPPGDNGGDVKNLPPEVKTLVGFVGNTPIFANNDSYWMDLGFPAIPWSNNRKIKPLAAVYIMDTDGKVNMNQAGNLRGFDSVNGSYPASAYGMTPAEINPMKLYSPNGAPPVTTAMALQELRQKMAGLQLSANRSLRGNMGIDPTYDPSTIRNGYWPLVRGGPFYSNLNADGTMDNIIGPAPNYSLSPSQQLPGQGTAWGSFPNNNTAAQGYGNATLNEWFRNGVARSPLFFSPFSPFQVTSNILSNNAGSTQRLFSLQNMEAMYRYGDTGYDKIDSDLRKLMPLAFNSSTSANPLSVAGSLTRWQMNTGSTDLNAPGVAPWYSDTTGDSLMPRIIPPAYAALDSNTARPAGPPKMLPWSAPAGAPPGNSAGEFVGQKFGQNLWRSIFGGTDRIDLAKQLPDYPAPATNDSQLDMANPVVAAQYMVALHARQKLADQIFKKLVDLTHPSGNASARWLAQLAVNIVDYIDNDDYPTWYQVPNISGAAPAPSNAYANNIVWGTELPRLVINEVYCEAVNGNTGPHPMTGMTVATGDYHVRHWVELFNPLNDAPFGAWPDGANARLTVNGTSAYRIIITSQDNMNNIRDNNFSNTMGYPDHTDNDMPTKRITSVVTFNGTTAANVNIPPSNTNYNNTGFYLVAPQQQPLDTTAATFPTMTSNPNNMYESPQMQVNDRIARATSAFQDNQRNRQAILLQRLANPYLPHNPIPEDPATPNTTLYNGVAGVPAPEVPDATKPYNPYITVDYVVSIIPNHAIDHDSSSMGNPDKTMVEDRTSFGKLQPYASQNVKPARSGVGVYPQQLWVNQSPDRDLTTAGIQKLQNQVQHTFLRHNSIEANTPQYGQKAGNLSGATPSANVNTIQLPFDWLVHLDRPPVSPAELLHVSGYRPHELTQMFHRMNQISATLPSGPTMTLTAGNSVRFTGTFFGTFIGVPFTVKLNDLVQVVYTVNPGPGETQLEEWVRVNNIASDYSWIEAEVSNSNLVSQNVVIQNIVPFSHTAPWYRATENVAIQSSNRIYRLLECVAVRNPQVDVGQVRFAATGVGPILQDGYSRWIQLDNLAGISGMPAITTNDALLGLPIGTPAGLQLPPGAYPINQPTYGPFTTANPAYPGQVGESVVLAAGGAEYRAMILEVDWQKNRIRTVLPDALVPATPFTVDYTYNSGRQPGRINLNTVWDLETFRALADAKPMNSFFFNPPYATPTLPGAIRDDALVILAYQRLFQQRQPGFFYSPRLPGHTGYNNIGEDRPLEGMGTGDVANDREIPRKGIGNTFLSDRYQEAATGYVNSPVSRITDMAQPVPYESVGTPLYPTLAAGGNYPNNFAPPERFLNTLFEMYRPQPVVAINPSGPTYLPDPGMNHPYRRFELLSKIWNNATVRSNTFAVWITIGFFEIVVDPVTGVESLGAELGQVQGKNTRYRFFSIVDRTSVDSWLKQWQLHDPNASVNLFANTTLFSSLDPRDATYPNIYNPDLTTTPTPVPLQTQVKEVVCTRTANPVDNVWQLTCMPEYMAVYGANPLWNMFYKLIQVTSVDSAGNVIDIETTSILNPTPPPTIYYDPGYIYPAQFATTAAVPKPVIYSRLTKPHAGASYFIVRPLPVPPTVLHWTQIK